VTALARPRLDLRTATFLDVLAEVERGLGTRLDTGMAMVKRRTVGLPSGRGTWVRIEARPLDKLHGQSGDGVQAAALVAGVNKPAWYRGMSWIDTERGVIWRADETERVTETPVSRGGVLTGDPDLPESWWRALARSLSALGAAAANRVATVHTVPITQERISATITEVFGRQVDTTITAWGAVHADLAWTNLTGPELVILDWEDYGRGPAGLDHASLWAASLAVPSLVERIEGEFAEMLGTRTGWLCQLFFLAELLAAPACYAGVLRVPAESAAAALMASSRR
jgi:hypothetical protein